MEAQEYVLKIPRYIQFLPSMYSTLPDSQIARRKKMDDNDGHMLNFLLPNLTGSALPMRLVILLVQ